MKIPDFLEPLDPETLVQARLFGSNKNKEGDDYQICDKSLHHVCLADNPEMAEFIVFCINEFYKNNNTIKNNGERMGEIINKYSGLGTIDRNYETKN